MYVLREEESYSFHSTLHTISNFALSPARAFMTCQIFLISQLVMYYTIYCGTSKAPCRQFVHAPPSIPLDDMPLYPRESESRFAVQDVKRHFHRQVLHNC